MNKKHIHPLRVLFSIFLVSLLTACGTGIQGDPTATSSAPTLPPAQPTIIMIDGTPQVVYEEQFPTPTLNLNQAMPVQLAELKFVQIDTRVTVLAKMRNTVLDAIAKDVHFEIVARDESGNRLHQETTMVKYIFPDEVTGLAYSFELMPGFIAKHIELRVLSGVLDRNMKYEQPLTVRQTSLQKTETESFFTAWLENADPYTYTQVRLNAIAYNKFDEIIGGGTGIVAFVPHQDQIGVSVPVDNLLEPDVARIEIYPWITQYSASLEAGKWWDTVKISDWNFEVTPQMEFGGGAILANLSKHLLVDTFYILTLSDEQGNVVKSDMGFIDYMWPEEEILFSPGRFEVPFTEIYPEKPVLPTETDEETQTPEQSGTPESTDETPAPSATPYVRGIGGLARRVNQETYPIETDTPYPTNPPAETSQPTETPQPTNTEPPLETPTPAEVSPTPTPTKDPSIPDPTRVYSQKFTVDFIIVPGEFGTTLVNYNPLKASQTAFVDDSTVKVSVVNNLNVDLPYAVVYVLVYNSDGQIVGGGKQLSDQVKASSATDVLVSVAYLGDRQSLTLKAFTTLTKDALALP